MLPGKGFYYPHPRKVFLQRGRKGGILFLVIFIRFSNPFEEEERSYHDDRDNNNGNPGQLLVQAQQSNEIDDKQQQDAPHIDCLICKKAADSIHIRGGALD